MKRAIAQQRGESTLLSLATFAPLYGRYRVPLENMVSQGLQAAWSCELQRVREEAALEVHAMYADDKAQLDFCMSEVQRLEKEVDRLEEVAVASKATNETSQIQAATALKEATDRATEYARRADSLQRRFEDLQRVDKEKSAEIALGRQQRERDVQELSERKAAHVVLQEAHQATLTAQATQASESARLEERCLQQQETLRYMRADIEAKTQDVEASRAHIISSEAELRNMREVVAQAEAVLKLHGRYPNSTFFIRNAVRTGKPITARIHKG